MVDRTLIRGSPSFYGLRYGPDKRRIKSADLIIYAERSWSLCSRSSVSLLRNVKLLDDTLHDSLRGMDTQLCAYEVDCSP